jgi:hypothetical protein
MSTVLPEIGDGETKTGKIIVIANFEDLHEGEEHFYCCLSYLTHKHSRGGD